MTEPDRIRGRLLAVLAQDTDDLLSARLCRAAPTIVGVDSAAVCLAAAGTPRVLVAASDELAEQLEQLQVELGEGPSLLATSTAHAVMVVDAEAQQRDSVLWMYLRRVAADTPVRAVFSFPIAVGSIAIGALDLYNRRPGPLPPESAAAAVQLADFLALAVLAEHAGVQTEEAELDWLAESPDQRAALHQATGVLIAQLGDGAEASFARLRAHAFRSGLSLSTVAQGVLDHTIRLER